jgi:REP element-mobilizing transposase RayT
MARPLRIQTKDALYHVTARGNEKKDIYIDDHDRYFFLKLLEEIVESYELVVYAFCLMGNHYHLLVRTPNANLSRGMRQLNGVYAQHFNKRHDRVGHLFQGRFSAVLIKEEEGDEERLLTAARYVVMNPVRAGLASSPEDWRWSSYRGTAGMTKPPSFLDPDQILSFFATNRKSACQQYIAFVRGGGVKESPFSEARGGIVIGGKELIEISAARLLGEISDEVPKRERFADRPCLEEIFRDNERDIGIYKAFRKYGYKLKDIGDFLGLHYSVISRIAKRVGNV